MRDPARRIVLAVSRRADPSDHVFVVEPDARGLRLLAFLEQQLPQIHRAELRAHLAGGNVSLNGATVVSDRRLRSGDVVLASPLPAGVRAAPGVTGAASAEGPTAASLAILFESETALVVAKPAGIPTVPDRSGRERGVHGLLTDLRPDGDLRVAHRLDRQTSGCLLLAKGLAAARHFDAAFRAGTVRKHYQALVQGVVRDGEFTIDRWLGPDPRRPGKVIQGPAGKKGFREAVTVVRRARIFEAHSVVDLFPRTGRGHQLRVHLSSRGHPIVGDRDYGGQPLLLSQIKRGYKPRLGFDEKPVLARTFLHALGLSFRDVDGREVAVETPLPEDLAQALGKLERFSPPRP